MGWAEGGVPHPSDPEWAYQPRVRRYLDRRLRGTGWSTDDAQQDIAWRLLRVPTWDDKDEPQAYAWTVAANVVNSALRRVRRWREHETDLVVPTNVATGHSTADMALAQSVLEEMLAATRGAKWQVLVRGAAEVGAWTRDTDVVADAVARFLPVLLQDLSYRIDGLRSDPDDAPATQSDVERTLSAAIRDALPPGHDLALPNPATTRVSDFKHLENRAQAALRRRVWCPVAHLTRLIVDEVAGPDWTIGRAGAWWSAYIATIPLRTDRAQSVGPWMRECEMTMSRLGLPLPPKRKPRGRGTKKPDPER